MRIIHTWGWECHYSWPFFFFACLSELCFRTLGQMITSPIVVGSLFGLVQIGSFDKNSCKNLYSSIGFKADSFIFVM